MEGKKIIGVVLRTKIRKFQRFRESENWKIGEMKKIRSQKQSRCKTRIEFVSVEIIQMNIFLEFWN